MRDGKQLETGSADLATLLGNLASRLRNDGLTLVGIASTQFSPGEQEHRDYNELATSLERTAALMEAAKDRLCQQCRLININEHVIFGRTRSSKRRS